MRTRPATSAPRRSRAGVLLRVGALSTALLLSAGVLTACSGDEEGPGGANSSPTETLEQAADLLASTSGAELELTSEDFPTGTTGIIRASGEVVDEPAFDGSLGVRLGGTDFDVPVIAFEDAVHAQIPLTKGWSDIDPAEYGAPNPALLLSAENGVGALLTATEEPQKGSTVRGGANNDQKLTSFTGTVSGEVMKKVIPSSAGDSYEVEHRIDEEGRVVELSMTGVFYADTPEMTYRLTISGYGLERTVTAP